MKLIITSDQSSLGCLSDTIQELENTIVFQEGQIKNFNPILHRNQVGGNLIYFIITLFHQQKSYILDVGGSALATEFLAKNLQILDSNGFFIFLMNENKTNVEKFLASPSSERFIKTIVLNLKENFEGKLMIDVYAKHYFSKNRRILTFILGSFVKKRFLGLDTTSKKKIR